MVTATTSDGTSHGMARRKGYSAFIQGLLTELDQLEDEWLQSPPAEPPLAVSFPFEV